MAVSSHYRELLHFCTHTLRDREAAADVVQEAYARLLALGRSEVVAQPRALLYRIARNLLADRFRRERVRDEQSLDALTEDAHPHAPRALQPEEALDTRQFAQAMAEVIEALPPRCREAFVLSRFEGLSHDEVAARMGISRNMVAQHVIRAMLACKACDERLRGGAA